MQQRAIVVRVFVNQPKANSRTKTIGNPAYAGAVGFMGHGIPREVEVARCAECAAAGHNREHGEHHEHHHHGPPAPSGDERFDVEFDLSHALREVEGDDDLTLKLVAVDIDGNDVAPDDFFVDEIEMVVD